MSILVRDDNVQFVVQPYRELLTYRTSNLLKREIRLLAQQNGLFVRIFKQTSKQYEVVFSRDSGFLLAEMIWRHLGQPADMIYCEALPDERSALVIIVRSGTILFDAKLPLQNLVDELGALLAMEAKFAVYVYGNLPISQTVAEGKLSFPEENLLSYNELDLPLFTHISPDRQYELLPLEQAIQEQQLGASSLLVTSVAAVCLIAAGLAYLNHNQVPQTALVPEMPSGLSQFQTALTTPNPTVELAALATDVIHSYSMPGWVATAISYQNGTDALAVHSLGGNVESLLNWAGLNQMGLSFGSTGATLVDNAPILNRAEPNSITRLNPVIARIIDSMMMILPGDAVSVTDAQNAGFYQSATLTITFNAISPNVLPLIGGAINGLPVTLNKMSAGITNGLLTGTIQLTVLGN